MPNILVKAILMFLSGMRTLIILIIKVFKNFNLVFVYVLN
jgi:hypothetical protein